MDEIHYWAEMQSELKNGFAEMGSALAKLIRAAEARNVPPLLEAVSLQVTPQRINRRGYTFAYLLVSEETLKALGTSLITLQMGTFVAQVQAGVGLVQLPLVEDGYISVPGLTGSWDALVYLTNEQAPSVTPLGSTTTSPLITELTGHLVPQTGWNTTLGTYSVTFAASAAAGTIETVSVPIPSPVQKDALYLVSVNNPSGLGTSVTVTFENAVKFGGSTVDYSKVTSVDVASGTIQSYLVQGWLLGDADAQISVSNDAAASSTGGSVDFEVTRV